MISLTYEKKPAVTVNLSFLSFTCSILHFTLKYNEIACKSPSISMLILILIFQSGTV